MICLIGVWATVHEILAIKISNKTEIFNISGKDGEPYMGDLPFYGGGGEGGRGRGLDNHLENMLYYLSLISLWLAIYTFPIT